MIPFWSGNLLWGVMFSLSWRWHLDRALIYSASFNSFKITGETGGNPHVDVHALGSEEHSERKKEDTFILGTESIKLPHLQFSFDCFTRQSIYWNKINTFSWKQKPWICPSNVIFTTFTCAREFHGSLVSMLHFKDGNGRCSSFI